MIQRTLVLMALAISFSQNLAAAAVTPEYAAGLGIVEGILSYCSKVHEEGKANYAAFDKLLAPNLTTGNLTGVRSSAQYLESYNLVTSELQKMSRDKAVGLCQAGFAGDKVKSGER